MDDVRLKDQVMAAARQAWELHGELPQTISTAAEGERTLDGLLARQAGRVEFVVDSDDADIWRALASMGQVESMQACALVPLNLLGTARDRLWGRGYELQGWWLREGKVAFGTVEIA